MEDFESLFNPQTEASATSQKEVLEFNPKADKGKGGTYYALVRFVPWWKNPTKGSIQEKWTCWLTDPITEKGKFVDCPSSIGKPSPLQDMYWKLKKSENAATQKKADIFSRRHSFASLVQVIKDDNNPETEGKIMVWRYGVKIWEKINAELKPVIGEKHDPFDPLEGKVLAVIVTKVSGFNNYDQTKFVDKKIPLCIPNENGKLKPITPESDKSKVFEWVKENSPDLEKYGYKEWDDDTAEYVNNVIVAVTGENTNTQKYDNVVNRKKESVSNTQSVENITSSDINLDDQDDDQDDDDLDLPDLNLDDDKDDDNDVGGIGGDLEDALKSL